MGMKKNPTQRKIEEFLLKTIDLSEANTFIVSSHADAGALLASIGNIQINGKRLFEIEPQALVIATAKGKKPFMIAVCYEGESGGNKKYREGIADSVIGTNSSFCGREDGSGVVKMTNAAIGVNQEVWPYAKFKISGVFNEGELGMMTFKRELSEKTVSSIPIPPNILRAFNLVQVGS